MEGLMFNNPSSVWIIAYSFPSPNVSFPWYEKSFDFAIRSYVPSPGLLAFISLDRTWFSFAVNITVPLLGMSILMENLAFESLAFCALV